MNSHSNSIIENTTVNISIGGLSTRFDFKDLQKFHKGDSWFGCAVGFRVMQMAARELSQPTLWSREHLYIVSGHPGAGVKDAIELVTACVSFNCFRLLNTVPSQGCSNKMKFEWWISDGKKTIHIKMNKDIVPETFFIKLDRLNNDDTLTDDEKEEEHKTFDQLKTDLSHNLWDKPLNKIFTFKFLSTALKAGELPND